MTYVKDNNKYTIFEIREKYPKLIIPDNADLTKLGYNKLITVRAPEKEGYYARELPPVNNTQVWELVKLPEPVEEVPFSITPAQARLILLEENLLDAVEEHIKTNKSDEIIWNYAIAIERQSPLIASVGSLLGLTNEQIDDLFIRASKLI